MQQRRTATRFITSHHSAPLCWKSERVGLAAVGGAAEKPVSPAKVLSLCKCGPSPPLLLQQVAADLPHEAFILQLFAGKKVF